LSEILADFLAGFLKKKWQPESTVMKQNDQRKIKNLEAIIIFSLSMVEVPFQWSPRLSRL
jgi:hypothetical protein